MSFEMNKPKKHQKTTNKMKPRHGRSPFRSDLAPQRSDGLRIWTLRGPRPGDAEKTSGGILKVIDTLILMLLRLIFVDVDVDTSFFDVDLHVDDDDDNCLSK